MFILAILLASLAWFVAAGALFFNPWTDKAYRSQEKHPAVRALPQSAKTMGLIVGAILVQVVLWSFVYVLVAPALPGTKLMKGLLFGLVLVATKIVPRDVDRLMLTTYPKKRLVIEFAIGMICAFVVGLVFAQMI